jgi:hypothetical protein
MNELTTVLGFIAFILQICAYSIYNWQIHQGKSCPNAFSWFFWIFLATMNAYSFEAAGKDWVVSFPFFVAPFACAFTFFHALKAGKLLRPELYEWIVSVITLAAFIFWHLSSDAGGTNLIVLVGNMIAFFFILKAVIKNPRQEYSLAWIFWSAASFLMLVNIFLRWSGQFVIIFAPTFFLLINSSIAILCSPKRKQKFNHKII